MHFHKMKFMNFDPNWLVTTATATATATTAAVNTDDDTVATVITATTITSITIALVVISTFYHISYVVNRYRHKLAASNIRI